MRVAISEYLTWKDLRADSKYAWSLLTFSGYLKPVEYEELPGDSWACVLAIPNREIKEVFAIQIGRWFSDNNPMFDALTMSDASTINNTSRALCDAIPT